MKQDTLEGKAKTKNGVKRLCFSIICILLEVIFIITIVTRLNEYAEIINLFTRILSGILVLGLYASNKTSSMKMPWIILILIFPIMGVGLYLLIGLIWWSGCYLMLILRRYMRLRWIRYMNNRNEMSSISVDDFVFVDIIYCEK